MRKYLYLLIPLFCFLSCDNRVDTAGDWTFIPVVYGLLDVGETAQYIRLEKAFIDPDRSAVIIAAIPDSVFVDQATVQLVEIGDRGRIENIIDFFLLDASVEGLEQEAGIFASTPNFLFKSTIPLNGTSKYELKINGMDTEMPITAETDAIANFTVFSPVEDGQITFEEGEETLFLWHKDDDASIFDLILSFTYREYNINNPFEFETYTINWTIAKNYPGLNGVGRLEIMGERFFDWIAANMPSDLEVCREALRFDLEIYAGGESLRLFMEAFEANQNGITGSIPYPRYTNLSEGVGVFSSRYKKEIRNIRPSSRLKEALSFSEITRDLGFAPVNDPCL